MEQFPAAETPLVATGILAGGVLLLAGLGVGWWLGPRLVLPAQRVLWVLRRLIYPALGRWHRGRRGGHRSGSTLLQGRGDRLQLDPELAAGNDSMRGILDRINADHGLLHQRLEKAETALKEQAREISDYVTEARTDVLTRLSNRRVFDHELRQHMAEVRRHGESLGVLLLDIDHFKSFNDRYGHLAGDAVLQEVARVLESQLQDSHCAARIGGEEFAVLLPGLPIEAACRIAERLRQAVEAAVVHYEHRTLQVTVSGGVAAAQPAEAIASLIKRTDQCLYASKASGRNRVHWHDGRQCLPVRCSASEWDPASSRLAGAADTEFQKVCAELRQQLWAIAEEERLSI